MRVLVVACGTRGDVQPALALALALIKAGHTAVLACPSGLAWLAEAHGCPFLPVGDDYGPLMERYVHKQNVRNTLFFLGFLRRQAEVHFRDLGPALEESDLVVSYFANFGVRTAAEGLGKPCLTLATFPQMLPSDEYPPVTVNRQNLPGFLNRLLWAGTRAANSTAFVRMINRERGRLGLDTIRSFWDYSLGRKVLLAADPTLGPAPRSASGPDVFQCGFLPLPVEGGLDPVLEAFLLAGPPPVFWGFGSMPGQGRDLTEKVIREFTGVGVRMIVQSGPSDSPPGEICPGVVKVGDVPHALLLPRTSAAIHHGGAGTTAAAAMAGIPQVIVPHLMDQFYWARRVHELGLGPKPLPVSRFSPSRLATLVRECLENEEYRANSAGQAVRMLERDGPALAVEFIEQAL